MNAPHEIKTSLQKTVPDGFSALSSQIVSLIDTARRSAAAVINVAMVSAYWEIGRLIVEEEERGSHRAGYGTKLVARLSVKLSKQFGKGFSPQNLANMVRFYREYPQGGIFQTTSGKSSSFVLSWSHYLKLLRIENPDERRFYEIEAAKEKWSIRELQRQFDSSLYERLALSRDKEKVHDLARRGQVVEAPEDIVKDPYVLEFLNLPEHAAYTESELEQRLIDNLRDFLLELGKGFAFVGRQVRLTFNEHHFWIDLVFYNRLLRCFVLLDLKLGELKHQDIGQMQMYVHHYDRNVKLPEENPTIGILLCADKDDAVVEMTLPEDNRQIFASQYKTVLPSKRQLQALLRASGKTTLDAH